MFDKLLWVKLHYYTVLLMLSAIIVLSVITMFYIYETLNCIFFSWTVTWTLYYLTVHTLISHPILISVTYKHTPPPLQKLEVLKSRGGFYDRLTFSSSILSRLHISSSTSTLLFRRGDLLQSSPLPLEAPPLVDIDYRPTP